MSLHNHASVSTVIFLGTFYMHDTGLGWPADSLSGTFSARVPELKKDPIVKAAPSKGP